MRYFFGKKKEIGPETYIFQIKLTESWMINEAKAPTIVSDSVALPPT